MGFELTYIVGSFVLKHFTLLSIDIRRHVRREIASLDIKNTRDVLSLVIDHLYGSLGAHDFLVSRVFRYVDLDISSIIVVTIAVIDDTAGSYYYARIAHLAYEAGVASSDDVSCSIIECSTTHHDTSAIDGNNVGNAA